MNNHDHDKPSFTMFLVILVGLLALGGVFLALDLRYAPGKGQAIAVPRSDDLPSMGAYSGNDAGILDAGADGTPHQPGIGGYATGPSSQNGYSVISTDESTRLYWFRIPGQSTRLLLRNGPAGFILADHAYWYTRAIGGFSARPDDFGWSYRRIPSTGEWSNHASGTALDINAYNHPQGSRSTYTSWELSLIHNRLGVYRGCIRWGGDYRSLADQMHWEINCNPTQARELARWLHGTYYGRLLNAANPNR